MEMVRAFFTLICFSASLHVAGQQFNILEEVVCWTVGPADSTLTRAQYVSVGGVTLTTFYINAAGQAVDVSAGGNLSFGKCGCCENVPPPYAPSAPYVDSITFTIPVIVVPPPPPPYFRTQTVYLEVENVTDSLWVEPCTSFEFSPEICGDGANNGCFSIAYTYTQLTPTRAAIEVDFTYDLYCAAPFGDFSNKITITTPSGSIAAFEYP